MPEVIRVSHTDLSDPIWMVAREIFRLGEGWVVDVKPVKGEENEYEVTVSDGARAVVIGKLGEIASLSVSKTFSAN